MSSGFLPAATASWNQRGLRPRPVHVLPASSRYLTALLRRLLPAVAFRGTAGVVAAEALVVSKSSSRLPFSSASRNHLGRGPRPPQTFPCPSAYLASRWAAPRVRPPAPRPLLADLPPNRSVMVRP